MRTAALFAIAVLFSAAVRAAAPKPEDWYTPETYEDEKNTGMFYYNGGEQEVKLNAKGEIVIDEDLQKIIGKDYRLKMAINAIEATLVNTKQIETLGQNLNDLLVLNGFKISRPDGGVYTVRFGNGSQSIKDVIRAAKDGKANATSDQRLADGFTVNWRIDGSGDDKKYSLQLVNANNIAAAAGNNEFWENYNGAYYVPMIYDTPNDANNTISYFKNGGIDKSVLDAFQFNDTVGKTLTLVGWRDAVDHKCAYKMSELLTSRKDGMDDERATHCVLTRKMTDDDISLHYVPIGDVISGLGLPPDGVSIEDHVEGNATNLAIKGWYVNAADEGVVLADLMTSEKSEGAQSGPTYHVLLRKLGEGGETNSIAYAAIGDLSDMLWVTNWTAAIRGITNTPGQNVTQTIVNNMTNLTFKKLSEIDSTYDRLVLLTAKATNDAQRAHETYIHLTNITYTAEGEVDSIYQRIGILTAKSTNAAERADEIYTHLTNLAFSASNSTNIIDTIYNRLLTVFEVATNQADAVYDTYSHLTNLTVAASNDVDAVYNRLMILTGKATNIADRVNETYAHITNLTYGASNEVDAVYNRLMTIFSRATNDEDRVYETYAHMTNLTVSASNEFDTVYQRLMTLTGRATNEAERVNDTYTHITNLTYSASNTYDTVYNRLMSVFGIAEADTSNETARINETYTHLTNLTVAATNEVDAIYNRLIMVFGSTTNMEDKVYEMYNSLTNLTYNTKDDEDEIYDRIMYLVEKATNDLERTNYQTLTNIIENMRDISVWQYVTNYMGRYLGVYGGGGGSGGGGGEEDDDVPYIDPKDDPYSSEYEPQKIDDYLLPLRNAMLLVAITNKPFSKIDPLNTLDFRSVSTNGESLVQVNGYDAAEENTVPVNRKKNDELAVEWMYYPAELLSMNNTEMSRLLRWIQMNNISNIFDVAISNADILADMATNLFGHVRAETLLDNDSVWTNGARQIEIKGYHSTAPFTVPYADWGEITNLVDRGGWDDQGWYEDVIDPETGATNKVWHENIVWVPDWQEEVVEGKKMVWEKYPLADSEAWSRYGVASWCTLTNDILAVEDEETGNVKGSVKALSLYGFEGANNAAIAYKHYPTSEDPEGARPQLRWSSPQDDYLPGEDYKYSPISNGMDIKWVPAASAMRVVGTDGSEAVVGVAAQTNTLTFASAADSNVQVGVQGDGNGNVTITIGVYYLTESALTPPVVE